MNETLFYDWFHNSLMLEKDMQGNERENTVYFPKFSLIYHYLIIINITYKNWKDTLTGHFGK